MKTLTQKLHEIYQEVKTIGKDDVVKLNSNAFYEAVSHDAVTDLVHEMFAKHGIVAIPFMDGFSVELTNKVTVYADGNRKEAGQYMAQVSVTVTLENVDDPNDKRTLRTAAYALDGDDKATGKAFSMAIKNLYLKLLLLRSLDKEEQRAMELEEQRAQPKSKPPMNHAQPLIDKAKGVVNHAAVLSGIGSTAKAAVDHIQTADPSTIPSPSFANYIIPIGTKMKGKRLGDVPKAEVAGMIRWIKEQAAKDGKPVSKLAKELEDAFINLYPEG